MNIEKAINVIYEIEQEMSDKGELTDERMLALDLAVNCLKESELDTPREKEEGE